MDKLIELTQHQQRLLPAIEDGLRQAVFGQVSDDYAPLRAMLAYHLGWEGEGAGADAQGKRIRPLLVLLSCAAAGGEWRRALPAATAVELVHNFSLIHDDIQDGSELRRGRATVWVKWGMAQAINAGDLMFILAHLTLLELDASCGAAITLQASRLLHQSCVRLTQGQYLDLHNETVALPTIEDYWFMVGGKTASLMGCCTELGALAAGVSDERRQAFKDYGYNLGLAFQVLDDWLGIWGDRLQTGKSIESDLASGKKTLPVLYALVKKGPFAKAWQNGINPVEQVPHLAALLADEGASEFTLAEADRLTRKANAALEAALPGESDSAIALRQLTSSLLRRQL